MSPSAGIFPEDAEGPRAKPLPVESPTCATCWLLQTTLDNMDYCGLKQTPAAGVPCYVRDRV